MSVDFVPEPSVELATELSPPEFAGVSARPQSLRRTVARVAPASLLVQIFSFGSSIVLAIQLGPTTRTDAYYLALSIPAVVYGVLLAGVGSGGIPTLTTLVQSASRREVSSACSELLSATLIVATALAVLVSGIMMVVLPAAAGGSQELHSLTREFIAELAPYAVTGALLGALGAVLAVRGRFVAPTMVLCLEPVAKSLLLIAFRRQLGVQALVIGNLGGNAGGVILLWWLLRRQGITIRPARCWPSPVVRAIFLLSAPLVLSQSLLQLNPLIDRTTAAAVGPGSVTVFELGVRLFSAPMALLASSLIAPLTATWSARLGAEGWGAVRRSFGRALRAVVLIVPPLVVTGVLVRHDLVEFAYSSHRYTQHAVDATANVLGALLLGMPAAILIVPLSTLFVIHRDTVFPLKVGIANCVLNAVLDLALRGPLGVSGIAASTAITLTVLCPLFAWEAGRRWGSLGLVNALRPLVVSLTSCAAIIAAGEVLLRVLPLANSRLHALFGFAALGTVALFIHVGALLCWPHTRMTLRAHLPGRHKPGPQALLLPPS